MARNAPMLAALVCCLCFAAVSAGTYEIMQDTTYTQLNPVNGQWNIKVSSTSTPDKSSFLPVTCDSPALTAACNQPPLSGDNSDKLKVQLQLKDATLKTIDNLAPKSLLVRACYTKASATDRPWRRSNNVIDKDKSCPFIIKSAPYNATAKNYEFDWNLPKNMTRATWFTSVLVNCMNGTGNSFCQYDSTVNQTYFATNIINSTPVSMTVAAAVCSAIGPLFLGVYFLRDMLMQRKRSG